jgi:hypothetical protein
MIAQQHQVAELNSYRCRIRPYNQSCDTDPALDTFLQLKAMNATEAFRSARLVAPDCTTVVDVERLDGQGAHHG